MKIMRRSIACCAASYLVLAVERIAAQRIFMR
jgi:hypothetical protein